MSRASLSSELLHQWQISHRVPTQIHTHNRVQDLYIDHDGLIARHDYAPEILGGTPAAHYLSGYSQFDGIMFPTHRKCCPAAATIDPTPRRS
jgi:hypothetical protein